MIMWRAVTRLVAPAGPGGREGDSAAGGWLDADDWMLQMNRGARVPGHGPDSQRKPLVALSYGEVRGAGGKVAGSGYGTTAGSAYCSWRKRTPRR